MQKKSSVRGLPNIMVKYEQARRTRLLHLSGLFLSAVPPEVWNLEKTLIRLDLSFNKLQTLSPAIKALTGLEQLWLNDNPFLVALPPEIEFCKRLEVMDLRRTRISNVPSEIGRLKRLVSIDLKETPFALDNCVTGETDTAGLMATLAEKDARESYLEQMKKKVSNGVYREKSDSEEGQHLIQQLVHSVCRQFEDLDDLRNVVRNCDRLFPPDLSTVQRDPERAAKKLKERFRQLRRENEKKQLSAELEIKLRAIYYDVIAPEKIEGIIASIYQASPMERPLHVEDIQFMIRNAPLLFPKNPDDITGTMIRDNVWALQEKLTAEREDVVLKLNTAIVSLYSDRSPEEVMELARSVAKTFQISRFATKKELEEMRKLSADAAQHFPSEYQMAYDDPAAIKIQFKQAQRA